MWHDGMSYGGAFWFMLILLLVLGVLAVVAIRVLAPPRVPPPAPPPAPRVDPEQVLAERLARGEIDDAEFTRVLNLLRTIR